MNKGMEDLTEQELVKMIYEANQKLIADLKKDNNIFTQLELAKIEFKQGDVNTSITK